MPPVLREMTVCKQRTLVDITNELNTTFGDSSETRSMVHSITSILAEHMECSKATAYKLLPRATTETYTPPEWTDMLTRMLRAEEADAYTLPTKNMLRLLCVTNTLRTWGIIARMLEFEDGMAMRIPIQIAMTFHAMISPNASNKEYLDCYNQFLFFINRNKKFVFVLRDSGPNDSKSKSKSEGDPGLTNGDDNTVSIAFDSCDAPYGHKPEVAQDANGEDEVVIVSQIRKQALDEEKARKKRALSPPCDTAGATDVVGTPDTAQKKPKVATSP